MSFLRKNKIFIIKALVSTNDEFVAITNTLPISIEILNERFYLIKMDETKLCKDDIVELAKKVIFDKYRINIVHYQILKGKITQKTGNIETINIAKV